MSTFNNAVLSIFFVCLIVLFFVLFFVKGAFDRLDPSGKFADHMINTIPVSRLGDKQELSNLALYLLSGYSSWCSGTVIDFDGGQLPFMSGMFNPLVKVRDHHNQLVRSMHNW